MPPSGESLIEPPPPERVEAAAAHRLLEEVAGPVIAQVIGRKARLQPGPQGRFLGASRNTEVLDAEDACSLARTRVAQALLEGREIADLRSYAASIAFHAWDETLHRRFPSRRRLLHRVRYVVEGQAARAAGFALWLVDGVETVGRAAWRGQAAAGSATPLQALREDPAGFIRARFLGRRFLDLSPLELLRACFEEIGGPLRWSDLAALLGDCWQEAGGRRESEHEELADAPALAAEAPTAATPDQQLSWLENLRWLWQELRQLGLLARVAFLLHAPVTRELEHHGIATLRELAAGLEMPPEEFAALWADIPLEDLRIAARYGLARQQVINLRKSARLHLSRKLAEYLRN